MFLRRANQRLESDALAVTILLNETHDPALQCWVPSANQPDTDFPIQNLPFGVFQRRASDEQPRVGIAIGDQVLDISACHQAGMFSGLAMDAAVTCAAATLNPLMALGYEHWSGLRQGISRLLRADSPVYLADPDRVQQLLVPMADVEMQLPAVIGDYTDFYASLYHASNVGRMFRPDNPLLPNYKYVPIGYHGRASSVGISGMGVRRPQGQTKDAQTEQPVFGPSKLLDYELEVGFFVGPGNQLGVPIPIAKAEQHVFGLCLVNDWSARDIQTWEYQPLGPFLAKSFATSISPWVVTLEALAPFRVPAFPRASDDPQPLSYLHAFDDQRLGGIDLTLEVALSTEQMRAQGLPPHRLSRGNFRDMYWTIAQLLTHHASNGCNLRTGDLLASGTVSGSSPDARGCLLELTTRGAEPIMLPTGEARRFLQDGDEVTLTGYCARAGAVRIGFGVCQGRVLPTATAP